MKPDNNIPNENETLDFNFKKSPTTIIKVIGVGGGGDNAVNHMYREGIHNVSFAVCNTDSKALEDSPVPTKVQLGGGLGAGSKPEVGRAEAEKSIDTIKQLLSDGTKMVFITAGMGGGTGTGAAPVVARVAKDMGILTVGIVTIPFKWEGCKRIDRALDGVDEIRKHVDALLVINNQRLLEIYSDMTFDDAFAKADETLSVAARSIAEIITRHGKISTDFRDVNTVLRNGGVAIMSIGYGEGEGRIKHAIQEALHSPLLNDNDIYKAKQILIDISYNDADEKNTLRMEEFQEIQEFMGKIQTDFDFKLGTAVDQTLGKKIKITILASGFGLETIHQIDGQRKRVEPEPPKGGDERERERRRGLYYGSTQSPYPRRYNVFIYPQEDLGNKDVISMVDASPTSERTKEQLGDINKLSLSTTVLKDAMSESESTVAPGNAGTTISFK